MFGALGGLASPRMAEMALATHHDGPGLSGPAQATGGPG